MWVGKAGGAIVVRHSSEEPWRKFPNTSMDDLFTGALTPESLTSGGEAFELAGELDPPIGNQEVWAAGVTYFRSRTARMEESAKAGASDFYDKVYHADRPELFFKATPHRVVGHGGKLNLRKDSAWMVPEPELTLALKADGTLLGYTIGNDLSSRDIEGENPLYLPQAKVFDRCAGLGPVIYITDNWPSADTKIEIAIRRNTETVFAGGTEISQMKQTFANLVEFLFRESSFPSGCFLMTGTGLVPPDDFTLQPGDEVSITIEPAGTLVNSMQ